LKLVAWRKKMLRFASEPAYQANYCRSNLLRPFALENSNGFEQILAHRIGCQRAKPPCPAERHSYSPRSISEGPTIVNTHSRFPQISSSGPGCLRHGSGSKQHRSGSASRRD